MDKETFEIIDRISKEHSNKTFGYLDKNDLKNEIWAICLEKISDFKEGRGKLEHFLRTTVRNRLINKFKDITKTVRSPCPRCQYYDKDIDYCTRFGENRYECKKWRNYKLSVDSRNGLLNATEDKYERYVFPDLLNQIIDSELLDIISEKLSPNHLSNLQEILEGKTISSQKLVKLRKEIIKILNSRNCGYKQDFIKLTISCPKKRKRRSKKK